MTEHTQKPIIGISGNQLVMTGDWMAGYPRAYVNNDYIRSIVAAGGVPLVLPMTSDHEVAARMLDAVDGLLLTGGHDVAPQHYGEEPQQKIGEVWPERDQFDFTLLRTAMEQRLPILGICRGHQIINVYFGGSLYQDLSYDENCTIKHAQNQRPGLSTHTIDIEPDSRLANILGATSWFTNSHHHQTVKKVGKNLRVTARAKDGTVEALESTVYPYLVSYQFHPEMMSAESDEAMPLFTDFIHVSKERMNAHGN